MGMTIDQTRAGPHVGGILVGIRGYYGVRSVDAPLENAAPFLENQDCMMVVLAGQDAIRSAFLIVTLKKDLPSMPLTRCPHCGKATFTVTAWADLDRCPECGRSLARRRIERATLGAGLGDRRRRGRGPAAGSGRRAA
jgi:hypothetical protein